MLLTIDSGNTNIVFAVFDADGNVRGQWRSSTHTERTADEFGIWLSQLMHLGGLSRDDVDAAILATVVPANLFTLKTLCRTYFGCEPLVVGDPDVDLGLSILVDRPEEVGADRLVNAVAAYERYGGSLVIIDFGTATTFDVVDAEGNYCGGVIAPGVNLSLEAMHKAAAQLPRVAIGRPERVIGKGTVEAMRSGIFWGVVEKIEAEFGGPMEVIATGGLAPLFADAVERISRHDLDLTLRGLLAIYRKNENKAKRAT